MVRNPRDDEPRVRALRDRTVVAPQTSFGRGLRHSATMAEKKQWRHLHRLSGTGTHFCRQVRFGRSITDFASHQAHLVIEVDGGQHAENAADAERLKVLEGQGYRVLRFWNNEVLGNVDGVLSVTQAAVDFAAGGGASESPPLSYGELGTRHGTAVPRSTAPDPIPPRKGGGSPLRLTRSPVRGSRVLTFNQSRHRRRKGSTSDARSPA